MATKEEISEQLAVTQKLAAAVDMMAKNMSRVESSFDNQIAAVEKLTQAIEILRGQDLSKFNATKLDNVQKEFKDTEKQVTGLTGRIKDLGNQMSKKFPTAAAAGAAAVSGFIQGIRNVIALGKGVTGFFASFVDGAASIAASIIAIPFKMFNALVDTAAAAGGGMNELAQAIENLRKEMGDLKGPGASAVIETSKTLQGFADTGLSAWRVFGTLAERLEHVTKVAVAMGSTFGVLTEEFRKNGGALLAFQKGLGVSEEGMKAIGDAAIRMGKPMTNVFLDMTKQTLALGKAFDIDQKLIGKDMVKAMQNVKHFGALTVKEIGQASVYARKLGLELDKIVGTLDAFETFDTAAENAAKLSQAFGVNVDAFKLMEAQNPAEQLDMLRKSFRDAGIDANNFSRQQAKLLAQATGLDEATVKQAFSAKNYGVSLDKVKKQSEAAEKKTLTQAEAMSKLADSIERMVKSGAAQEGGFWQMFVKGFLGGIQASKEFRQIIWNIKRALQVVYFEGVRLGKAFVEMFPGVKQFLGGIADFFQPAKFKKLAGGVVDVLKDWMKDLQDPNGKASFSALMEKLREKFFDFFDSQSASGKKMLDGFKTVIKTITKVIAEGIKWAADKIGEALKFITEIIKDPSKLMAGAGAAAAGPLGFLGEVLMPLVEALHHAWKIIAPALWDLVKTLGKKLWEYLTSDEFINLIKPALPYVAAALFGPAFIRALFGAGVTALGKAAIKLFTSGSTKKLMEDVAKKAAGEVMEASQKVAAKGGAAGAEGMKQVSAVNKAAGTAVKPPGGKDWGVKDAVKLGLKLVAIAAALALGGVMMAISIVAMKKILEAGGIKTVGDVVAPLLVLGAMVVAAIPLVLAMRHAAKVGSMGDVFKGGLIISAAVAIVGAVGAGIAWLMKQVAEPAQLKAAGDIMLKMSLVFLAMVPLIFASMVIGALATGPQAIALGLAAVGMGVIGVAVAEMAGITVGIIKELAALKVDADFQRKIDAFLGVMKSIQAFADTLVKIIDLMTPTFGEIISGKVTSFKDKVDSATKLIGEMVGQRGGKTGIIGVIETVMDSIRQMNIGGPGMAESAKVFADVMSGITEFMKAAAPPDAFYEEGGSFINKLVDPTHNFQNLATDVNHYVKLMREGALEMLTGTKDGRGDGGVMGIIKKFAVMVIPSPESAQVVASLIGSTAQILKAITPSPETMKAFTETSEGSAYWDLIKTKVSKFNVDAIKATIETMGGQLNTLLPTLVDNVITKVVDKAKGLSKEQLENVKALGGIMSTVGSIASSISGLARGKEVTPVEVAGAVHWSVKEAPNLKLLFDGIGNALPSLIESVITAVSGIKLDTNFAEQAKKAESLFGFIKTMTDVAGTLAGAGTGKMIEPESMVHAFQKLAWFMWAIVHGGGGFGRGAWGADEDSPLKLIVKDLTTEPVFQQLGAAKGTALKAAEGLTGLFKALSDILTSLSKVSSISVGNDLSTKVGPVFTSVRTVMEELKKVMPTVVDSLGGKEMQSIGVMAGSFKKFGAEMQKVADAIKMGGVSEALGAVEKMVTATKSLDDQLNQLPKLTPSTVKLEKVAEAAGLGGKGVYTVRSKDINITINMSVTMNAADLEKALILRGNSFVRQRLDFLAEKSEASPLIGGDYNPAPSGVPPLGGKPGSDTG